MSRTRWSLAAAWLAILAGMIPGGLLAAPKQESSRPVWPPPPDPPRIAFLQAVSSPADLGSRRSVGSRIVGFLIGDDLRDLRFKPTGVAADDAGNLLLADAEAGAVCLFDARHRQFRRWDRIGIHHLVSPVAVARVGGTCYLADSGLGAVLAFAPDGQLRWAVTNGLVRPSGLAILGGKVFVAEAGAHRISVYDGQGIRLAEFGRRGAEPGEFNYPTHLAASPNGRLIVTDAMNARVQILEPTGHPVAILGSRGDGSGHFSRPKGVAVDLLGHIYVVDALFDNVQVFDAEGQLLLHFGGPGHEAGEFWLPGGIAATTDHRLFVADTYNHRVQIFRYLAGP